MHWTFFVYKYMIIERYKTKCLTLKIIDVFHIILLLHHILQNKTWMFLKNAVRDKNIFFCLKVLSWI